MFDVEQVSIKKPSVPNLARDYALIEVISRKVGYYKHRKIPNMRISAKIYNHLCKYTDSFDELELFEEFNCSTQELAGMISEAKVGIKKYRDVKDVIE